MASPLAPDKPIPGVTDTKPGQFKLTPENARFLGLPEDYKFTPAGDKPGFNILDPLGVGSFLGKLSNVYLWRRIGIGVLGALFLWWGILIILASNKQIQAATIKGAKAIASKTPQGAAANIATGALE